ncbi:MAG: lysylphosphatidylglycerol synthase domain-containing protein [Hydrogenophilus sp.]|nr:lysylphosphatidylglycerol synthase domain-containing protein [Hydrogenophilus sp.]
MKTLLLSPLRLPRSLLRLFPAIAITAAALFLAYPLLLPHLATRPWQHWSFSAFLPPLLFLFLSHATRALRLAVELPELPLSAVWKLLAWHTFAVNILPFRTGELTLPLLLHHRHHLSLSRSTATLLWLRLQDLTVLTALAILLWPTLPLSLKIPLLLLLPLLFHLVHLALRSLARRSLPLLAPLLAALAAAAAATRGVWHWTLLSWSLKIAALALLLGALLHQSPLAVAIAAVGGEFAAIQPLQGIAGFGPYEAAVAALLLPLGVPLAAALTAALAAHLLLLFTSAFLALLAALHR